MAYPHPFLRLVLGGRIYNSDIFTFSMSLSNGGQATEPPDEVPQGIIDAAAALFTFGGVISSGAALQWIKLNQIGQDGRYTEDTTVLYDYPADVPGTAPTCFPAPQVALCITLRTAVSRGPATRGRFYLPTPFMAPGAQGYLTLANQQTVATEVRTFLNDVVAALPGYALVVMSETGSGAMREVTTVSVGRVLDTIRSRRNAFDESYWDLPLEVP